MQGLKKLPTAPYDGEQERALTQNRRQAAAVLGKTVLKAEDWMRIHKDAAPNKQALSKSVEGWSCINTHEQAEAWRPGR